MCDMKVRIVTRCIGNAIRRWSVRAVSALLAVLLAFCSVPVMAIAEPAAQGSPVSGDVGAAGTSGSSDDAPTEGQPVPGEDSGATDADAGSEADPESGSESDADADEGVSGSERLEDGSDAGSDDTDEHADESAGTATDDGAAEVAGVTADEANKGSKTDATDAKEDKLQVAEGSMSGTRNTVKWAVDSNGVMTISPLQGDSGTIFNDNPLNPDGTLSKSVQWNYNWSQVKSLVKSVRFEGTIHLKDDCAYMFNEFNALETVDLHGLETSECTNLARTFHGCRKLKSIDVGTLDFSNLVNMTEMFDGCSSLGPLDFSGKQFPKLHGMSSFADGCSSATSISFRNCSMPLVSSFREVFKGCSSAEKIDLEGIYLPKDIVDFYGTFQYCKKIVELDLRSFHITKDTNTQEAFDGCILLSTLKVDTFSPGKWNGYMGNGLHFKRWKQDGSGEIYVYDPKVSGADSWPAGTYIDVDPRAVLYNDGELVFQLGADVDEAREPTVWEFPSPNSTPGWHSKAAQVKKATVKDPITPQSTFAWFEGMSELTTVEGLDKLDMSQATKIDNMFSGCSKLTAVDANVLAAPQATSAVNMFANCSALSSVDLSGWDTTNVTSMVKMFYGCKALTSVKLGTMEMANMTYMYEMFNGCKNLVELDVQWSQGGAEPALLSITNMFKDCEKLASINLNGLVTDKVTSFYELFSGCESLESLDLSGFNSQNVTSASYMFANCSKLTELDLSRFDFAKNKYVENMFKNCNSLQKITLGKKFATNGTNAQLPGDQWRNTDSGETYVSETLFCQYDGATMAGTYVRESYYAMLYESGDFVFQVGDTPDSSMGSLRKAYHVNQYNFYARTDSDQAIAPWHNDEACKDVVRVTFKDPIWPTSTYGWFYGFENLTALIGMENLHTDYTMSMRCMFDTCTKLQSIDLSHFVTDHVRDMRYLFSGSTSLAQLDLTTFDTAKVTSMESMFSKCTGLEKVTLGSDFAKGRADNHGGMFENCESLTSVDVSNINVSSTDRLSSMFKNCKKIEKLDLSSLTVSKYGVQYMSDMFAGMDSLGEISFGEGWNFKSSYPKTGLPGMWARDTDQESISFANGCSNWSSDMAGAYYRVVDMRFDATGGTASKSTVTARTFHPLGSFLPTAQRDNYDFDGWFTEKYSGQKVDADTPIPSGVETLYAHWVPRTYTLVFDANDLSGERKTVELKYDEPYTLRKDVFPRDYAAITGWNTHPSGSGTAYFVGDDVSKLVDSGEEIVLYAQWKRLTCTMRFDAQGGTPVPDRKMTEGDVYGAPPVTEREGYTFRGWTTNPTGGKSYEVTAVATGDAKFYAQWGKKPTITFDVDGGTPSVDPMVLEYYGTVDPLPVVRRQGYQFEGWYSGSTKLKVSTQHTSDKTYKAKWKMGPKYDLCGIGTMISAGVGVDSNTDPSNYVIPSLPTVRSHDHTFAGWYTKAVGGERVDVGDTINLLTTPTLYARWTDSAKVTISFDADGGQRVDDRTLFKGDCFSDLPTTKKDGYSFDGWYRDLNDDASKVTGETTFDADATLYARWSKLGTQYTVSFRANGSGASIHGSSTYSLYVRSGETIRPMPGCTRSGYVFDGWYTSATGGRKVTGDDPVTSSLTLYAHWASPDKYEFTSSSDLDFSAYWSTTSSSSLENTGNHIDLHPTGSSSVSVGLTVNFSVSMKQSGTTASSKIAKGAASIKVPKYLFRDWDGNPTGAITGIGKQLAMYPGVSSGIAFSYKDCVDYYELVNVQELDAKTAFGVTLNYSVDPKKVKGGWRNEDGTYAGGAYVNDFPVTASVDTDGNGTPDISMNKSLSAEFHSNPNSKHALRDYAPVTYFSWQDGWGTEPADADQYFYVRWTTTSRTGSESHQSMNYVWDFDKTTHDGEVVCSSGLSGSLSSSGGSSGSKNYVVMRYPKTLLDSFGTASVTLKNEAVVHETWQDGTTRDRRTSSQMTVARDTTPVGSLTKNYHTYNGRVINGGQETILDDEAVVKPMMYHVKYTGHDNQPPNWDAAAGAYSIPDRTIVLSDGGRGSVLYASGIDSDGDNWEPGAGNVELSENDYSFTALEVKLDEFDSQYFGSAWVEPYAHKYNNDYRPVEVWIRQRGSGEWFLLKSFRGTGSGNMTLPKNTVAFEVRHSTNYYSTAIEAIPVLQLEPTTHVKELIKPDATVKAPSYIKNKASVDVKRGSTEIYQGTNYKPGGSAYEASFELNLSKTKLVASTYCASTDNVSVDITNRTQDATFTMSAFNSNNSGRKKPLQKGTFYNLLPIGTAVAENTIHGRCLTTNLKDSPRSLQGSVLSPGNYAVSYVPNWEGTGRTMMIVNVAAPASVKATGFMFQYTLHNTYSNIVSSGTSVANDVAFVNTSDDMTPYDSITKDRSAVSDPESYRSVEQDFGFERIAYVRGTSQFLPVEAYTYEFSVSAAVADNGEYAHDLEVTPRSDYSYRLMYSQSDVASGTGVVMFDVLERNVTAEGEVEPGTGWDGTFSSIDVGSIRSVTNYSNGLKCAPVVYYSTKARDSFGPSDFDLSRSDVWSTEPPSYPGDVTAVAVDCSLDEGGNPFELRGQKYLTAFVHMKAPAVNAAMTPDQEASINGALLKTKVNGMAGASTASARVTMSDFDITLEKSADPASGTAEAPTVIYRGDDIVYSIDIKNSGTTSARELTIEDAIPDPMIALVSEMTVSVSGDDDVLPLSSSPRVSAAMTGNDLSLTVHEVLAGETLSVHIPAYGDAAVTKLLENTAHLTNVNGVSKSIDSNTTYHKYIGAGTIEIAKKIRGSNVGVSDEFEFTVTLGTPDVKYSGKLTCSVKNPKNPDDVRELSFVDGVASLKLVDGDVASLQGVPIGLNYRVSEKEYANYVTSVVGQAEGTVSNEVPIRIVFVNDGSDKPLVGVNSPLSVPLAQIALILLTVFVVSQVRRVRVRGKKRVS